MVTNKTDDMEKIIALCGEDFTTPDMRKKLDEYNKKSEVRIFTYNERSIKLYLDELVDRKELIFQNVRIRQQKRPAMYSKDINKKPKKVRRNDCSARNDIIYKDLCVKYCIAISCNAYYRVFNNDSKSK